jgi:4-amino-4-deoxy-L-arabinose transferase-like glycosyltransferase
MADRRWIAPVGLAAALALGVWLRAVLPATVQDLRPRPDALEYEEAARNILDGNGYFLVIEGSLYPPRYPFGFSLLLVPLLWAWDAGPGTGVVIVLACAIATLVAVWRLARDAAGPSAGAVAAFLVAASPVHVEWSRAVMSDVPAACATTWLLVGVVTALRRDRSAAAPGARQERANLGAALARWAALGLGIGLTALLRIPAAAVAAPAALGVLLDRGPFRLHRLTALGAGLVLGLTPLWAYGLARFGSPLRSGYDLWVSGDAFFSLEYLSAPPAGGGEVSNGIHYGLALAGLGDLYSWPIAVLVLVGFVEAVRAGGRRGELAWLALAFTLPTVAAQVVFFWQDTRFLLPIVPVLLCVAALPFAPEVRVAVRASALALAIAGLVLLARSPTLYAREKQLWEPTKLRQIDALVPPNAAVLAHSTEPFVRRILRRPGTDRIWVPIGLDAHQLARRLEKVAPTGPARDDGGWMRHGLDPRSAEGIVREMLSEGRPVYLSTMLRPKVKRFQEIFRALDHSFRLEPVLRRDDGDLLFAVHARGDPPSRPTMP